jgi:hypothetical protein
MTAKKPGNEPKRTSLNIDPAVYRRAWDYKLDNPGKDLGQIVSEALDEYLKKRGA